MITRAFRRTGARLISLYETLMDEYWDAHKHFNKYGCSLKPGAINYRALKTATVCAILIAVVSLPVILYYRGFSEPALFAGLSIGFGFSWLLVVCFVWVAHLMWVFTYALGRKFGGSRAFIGFIEKRWGNRIDKIAEKFMSDNNITTKLSPSEIVKNPDAKKSD